MLVRLVFVCDTPPSYVCQL